MANLPRGSFRRLSRQGYESVLRVFEALHDGNDPGERYHLVSASWPAECDGLAALIFARLNKGYVRALIAAAGAGLSGIVKYIIRCVDIPLNSAMLNRKHFIVTA